MPKTGRLDIAERKSGAIRLTPAEAQPEPKNLRRIKAVASGGHGHTEDELRHVHRG
ncbi:hypothetical protein SUDANB6_05339 [Streptomyces sp. enrichment culture]|uniref:hypothetical protein n=1 Tax=Streptomyces sp. enrichment culture TaxID=1795815 RepID=UPI003F54607E